MDFILQWVEVLWLVPALAVLQRRQRLPATCFFAGCFIIRRLLTELMESIGYPRGLIGFVDTSVAWRGLIVYSCAYVFYIVFMYCTPRNLASLTMASSLTVGFLATLIFTCVMVL